MLSTLRMIPTKLKHKKLSENYIEAEPVVIEGMSYTAKYVGMTLVDSPKGEEMAAGAIKRIVTSSKASVKEPPIVILTVSTKGIEVKDASSNEVTDNVDITRISFCTADKAIGKVFGYVSQNVNTESFECHAYMCGSRKEAQKLALTVAQSFSVAYDCSHSDKQEEIPQLEGETSSSGFSLDNKKFSSIYRSIADSRYKRLSDSFNASSESLTQEEKEINATEDKESDETESFNFEFSKLATEPIQLPSSLPSRPTVAATSVETKEKVKISILPPPSSRELATEPIQLPSSLPSRPTIAATSVETKEKVKISILPPPSSRGKQQSKRIPSRPSASDLVDISAAFQQKSKIADEAEETDFDFAQFAMSRTKSMS